MASISTYSTARPCWSSIMLRMSISAAPTLTSSRCATTGSARVADTICSPAAMCAPARASSWNIGMRSSSASVKVLPSVSGT